ncbi:IS3 family transposase [Enterococcus termitis]|uniref:IS3 family transposase n=1 Tax=Enterococcus termitis TaxID=332950 RepID=UPI0036333F83
MIGKYRQDLVLQAIKLPRSTFNYWKKRLLNEEKTPPIEACIKAIFEENQGNYGYRRIKLALAAKGYQVNHKKVQRIMKKHHLVCTSFTRRSRSYRSYKGRVGTVAKNRVNRRFFSSLPRQKIYTDISEFHYTEINSKGIKTKRKAYLSPFLDGFNGEIIAYKFQQKPTLDGVLLPLELVIEERKNVNYRMTIHSDQGWHYQNKQYTRRIKQAKMYQSMSRKGNCLDNALMENFFGLMKQEMYYRRSFFSFKELELAVTTYIHYYNHHRIKEKLTGMSPVQYRIHTSQLAG